jgi:NADH-quinone oxidoreductase subunit L
MTIPLILLAALSLFGGFIGIKTYYHDWFLGVLTDIGRAPLGIEVASSQTQSSLPAWVVPLAFVFAGVLFAWHLYRDRKTDPLHIEFLAHKFYFDEIYERSLVGGQQMTARTLNWIDSWILEGLIIRGMAFLSVGVGEILRLFQTGSLQTYAFIFSLGGIVLIYFTLFAH